MTRARTMSAVLAACAALMSAQAAVAAATPAEAARAIVRDAPGSVSVSADCGAGPVGADDRRRVRDGGALKAAVLLAALAADDRPGPAVAADPALRRVLADGDLAGANGLIDRLGDGSAARGTVAVNGFLARAGLADSVLDGPYRQGGGPSRKRTSARDLRLMVSMADRATRGGGPLPALGVSRDEGRLARRLMLASAGEGLLAGHIPGRIVAHRGGRLADVQNDAAVIVTPGGVRCAVAVTAVGTARRDARAAGGRVMREVVAPLVAAASARPAPAGAASGPEEAPPGTGGDEGGAAAWLIAAVAVGGLGLAVTGRHLQIRARRRARERRRRERSPT